MGVIQLCVIRSVKLRWGVIKLYVRKCPTKRNERCLVLPNRVTRGVKVSLRRATTEPNARLPFASIRILSWNLRA
ncbi:hypothetical protein AG1IA_09039 [Rhizoctonia solani AG-1 IA]|uniref:Uncharacterized protein n=1 Tax=Thanatephorus cucumeris (strain AG1-IA) TaxID=983506 RepID=L8WG40_THACA|nr:hypothetical protein AG1IA_09039 [Rhizoctonia solani AG-1 IA]